MECVQGVSSNKAGEVYANCAAAHSQLVLEKSGIPASEYPKVRHACALWVNPPITLPNR